MVTGGREICGRAGILAMLDRFWSNPEISAVRVTSVVETQGSLFRYQAVTDFYTRPSVEVFDAGEVNEVGQISLILTFSGPLDVIT